MLNYCTLFDTSYLSRGLAMYESLKNNSGPFHLYIFAFDDLSFSILKALDLSNITLISLKDFETPELLLVKGGRSRAEYCWTCTPSVISHVLNKYDVLDCTYIDSDLIFYSDPSLLVQEMLENKKNVLITEHRFSPLARIYEEKRAGRFCVQFVTFLNEKNSLVILEKWKMQCIDWCYARHEDGKFGDQKYLDEWPSIYDNIHILQNHGSIAPWNLQQYFFKKSGSSIIGKIKKSETSFNVVFFHFQYVKFIDKNTFDIGWYIIPDYVKKLFYTAYLEKILDLEKRLESLNSNYHTVYSDFKTDSLKNSIKAAFKKSLKYNIIKM